MTGDWQRSDEEDIHVKDREREGEKEEEQHKLYVRLSLCVGTML